MDDKDYPPISNEAYNYASGKLASWAIYDLWIKAVKVARLLDANAQD